MQKLEGLASSWFAVLRLTTNSHSYRIRMPRSMSWKSQLTRFAIGSWIIIPFRDEQLYYWKLHIKNTLTIIICMYHVSRNSYIVYVDCRRMLFIGIRPLFPPPPRRPSSRRRSFDSRGWTPRWRPSFRKPSSSCFEVVRMLRRREKIWENCEDFWHGCETSLHYGWIIWFKPTFTWVIHMKPTSTNINQLMRWVEPWRSPGLWWWWRLRTSIKINASKLFGMNQ